MMLDFALGREGYGILDGLIQWRMSWNEEWSLLEPVEGGYSELAVDIRNESRDVFGDDARRLKYDDEKYLNGKFWIKGKKDKEEFQTIAVIFLSRRGRSAEPNTLMAPISDFSSGCGLLSRNPQQTGGSKMENPRIELCLYAPKHVGVLQDCRIRTLGCTPYAGKRRRHQEDGGRGGSAGKLIPRRRRRKPSGAGQR